MGADILRLPDSATDECDNPTTGVENRFQDAGDRQVQVLLWDYVKGLLKEAEQEEIKKALGVPAIEENEQLFTEAASLEEILSDLQQGTEKQAEVQKLFQTPARSMVEDEIRLLLEAIHQSSSEPAARSRSTDDEASPQCRHDGEPEIDQDADLHSPSESFYELTQLKSTRSKPANARAPQSSHVPTRRDCHSAPIPMQSAEDKRILEYVTARPASSGSLRPRTADGRSLLRPGTAFLARPGTSASTAPNLILRPQTAAAGLVLDAPIMSHGRFSLHLFPGPSGWETPNGAIPTQHGQSPQRNAMLRNSLSQQSDWGSAHLNFGKDNVSKNGACALTRPGSAASLTPGSSQRERSSWDCPSRPSTQQGRPQSRSTEGGGGSRPGTGSSAGGRGLGEVVEAVADRLNVFQIEVVAAPLRQALADERAALLEDIEYLRQLIDEEADMHHKASRPPPSVKDLRDYSARLEASLREHIMERNLKQDQAAPSQGKHSTGTGRTANGLRSPGICENEGSRQSSRSVGSPKGSSVERAGLQSGEDLHRLEKDSGALSRSKDNKSSNGVGRPVCRLDDGLEDDGMLGTKRTSSRKVHRLRSLVMDSQTEASGATSLCRAQIT